MICEECKSCPIETLCDKADAIIDENLSLDGEHDILMAIYEKGRADAEKELQGLKDLGKLYSEIRADERNNVLSILKKLIDSDYKSKDCQLLFADLCEMLVEQLKEQKNEYKRI